MTIVAEVGDTEAIIRDAELTDVTGFPSFDAKGNPGIVRADPEWYGIWYRTEDGHLVIVTWQGRVLWGKALPGKFREQTRAVLRLSSRDMRILPIPLEGLNPKHLAARRKNPYCAIP